MFFLASIKKYLIIGAALSIAVVGMWKFYQYKENQLQVALIEAERARQAAEETQSAIDSMQLDYILVQEQFEIVSDRFDAANNRVEDLERRLGEHDLGYLAQERPGLVEPIINRAAEDMNRCMEIASGSILTEEELNVTLTSRANSICPGLANPNYVP
jgi:hypothetical protein